MCFERFLESARVQPWFTSWLNVARNEFAVTRVASLRVCAYAESKKFQSRNMACYVAFSLSLSIV